MELTNANVCILVSSTGLREVYMRDEFQQVWDIETHLYHHGIESPVYTCCDIASTSGGCTLDPLRFPHSRAILLLNEYCRSADVADFDTRPEDLNDGFSVSICSCQSTPTFLDQVHDAIFRRIESIQNWLVAFNANT